MSRYSHPALRQLTEQQPAFLRRCPAVPDGPRGTAPDRARTATEYKYQEICEKITGYRPDAYPDLWIDGATAIHDIQLFVEDVSASANLPVDQGRRQVLTVEDLSRKYNVSTKTVDRWRKRGWSAAASSSGTELRVNS